MTKSSGGHDLSQTIFKCIRSNYEVGTCIYRILEHCIVDNPPPAVSFTPLRDPTPPIIPIPDKKKPTKKRPLDHPKREKDINDKKKKKISVDRHVEHAYDAFCVLKKDSTLTFLDKANFDSLEQFKKFINIVKRNNKVNIKI